MLKLIDQSLPDPECDPAARENLAEMFNGNMFTNADYLRALGHDDLLISKDGDLSPLLLSDRNSHLLSLDRLQTLSKSEIHRHSTRLFETTAADFIVFEDILIDNDGDIPGVRGNAFCYKANWWRSLSADGKFMSSKQASALRRKQKKLQEHLGNSKLEFCFGRTRPGDVAAIVELNRAKIEGGGRRHQVTDEKLSAMEILCASIGYTARLVCDGELIAGNILCVAGSHSFIPMLGHDLRYEKFSPGLQVTSFALAQLERIGCTESNFLWGDSRWKSDFKAERQPLTTLVVRRNNRVLLSRDYRRVVLPYAKAAAKMALKPHVKPLLNRLGAATLTRLLLKR